MRVTRNACRRTMFIILTVLERGSSSVMPDCRGKDRGGHWRKSRRQQPGKKLLGQEPSCGSAGKAR